MFCENSYFRSKDQNLSKKGEEKVLSKSWTTNF